MDNTIRDLVLENLRDFSTAERPVYLVGGAVRDPLLGLPIHDLDFVMAGETLRLAQETARRLNGALYVLDAERNTTRVVLELEKLGGKAGNRLLLDFSVLRGNNITEDLQARDFTINAMAYDVRHTDHLIDPTGGLSDLREKRIKPCSSESFENDPVRVLRAVRQAIQFGFQLDPDTVRLLKAAVSLLPRISSERLRDELFRMLDGQQVSLAIQLLDRLNALGYVLPELESLKGVNQSAPHVSDVWAHTLKVVYHLEQLLSALAGQYQADAASDLTVATAVMWLGRYREEFKNHYSRSYVNDRSMRGLLFLAALYHDISKPVTKNQEPGGRIRFFQHQEIGAVVIRERARELAFSSNEIDHLDSIVRHHMRVHSMTDSFRKEKNSPPTRRTIYRFFRDVEEVGVDICLLSLADVRGTYGLTLPQDLWEAELEVCRNLLEAYWEKNDEVVSPQQLLNGHELIKEFGLKPGKEIGQILGMIREAQAAGEISSREEAQTFVHGLLERNSGRADFSPDVSSDRKDAEE